MTGNEHYAAADGILRLIRENSGTDRVQGQADQCFDLARAGVHALVAIAGFLHMIANNKEIRS